MSTRNKVEFIPKITKRKCYFCKGKGCKKCNKGNYEYKSYTLIYKNMAFAVDTIK